MSAEPKPTHPTGRLLAVLTRMLFALLIAGGALGTASALPVGLDSEVVEESEDERPSEQEGVRARVAQPARSSGSSSPGALARLDIPRVLTPAATAPQPPSWQRPRRTVPDDDDGTAAAQV